MWINYQFMAVCPLILNFLHISPQKWLVFAYYFGLPNFLPQLANFFTWMYPSYPWHFPTLDQSLTGVSILWEKSRVEREISLLISKNEYFHFSFYSWFWRVGRKISFYTLEKLDNVPLSETQMEKCQVQNLEFREENENFVFKILTIENISRNEHSILQLEIEKNGPFPLEIFSRSRISSMPAHRQRNLGI